MLPCMIENHVKLSVVNICVEDRIFERNYAEWYKFGAVYDTNDMNAICVISQWLERETWLNI